MRLQRNFIGAKLNTDLDERLLQAGEYPHAENIRVVNSEGADAGAIENVKGNFKLTDLGLLNGKTIGAYSDSSNQKLYWFVTSDTKDMVLEYDVLNSNLEVLLESSKGGVLNFNSNYLITGVVKIPNGDSKKDLLCWTDDYNAPRIINIERAKTYGLDGFEEDDISLIKKPPTQAPKARLTYSSTTVGNENNLENKFIAFATRYKYLDGEYSALSSFTPYCFSPKDFDLDYQTMENNGMINNFNAIDITFDTGSKRVVEIDIVFKESNSNTVYIVETFNKKKKGWGDDEEQTFQFHNNKKYIALPESELYRTFDNVPRLAKAGELIGNRLVLGNYVEGYNLTNVYGENINIDFDMSLIHNDISGLPIDVERIIEFVSVQLPDTPTPITIPVPTKHKYIFNNIQLTEGSKLTFDIGLGAMMSGEYSGTFEFILNRDYSSVQDLASDSDFITFIEEVLTNAFISGYYMNPPEYSEVTSVEGFSIVSADYSTLTISAPIINYLIEDTDVYKSYWGFNDNLTAFAHKTSSNASVKSNRSYEAVMIYLDEYNRATTGIDSENNTIYIPHEFSTYQNKLVATINHQPPYWAKGYKFAIKQNKGEYQTIYANIIYSDGIFTWVKLEGANKDKVHEGDTLIVKADLDGVVETLTKVRVLEIETKESNFLVEDDSEMDDIYFTGQEAGLYMKIKPVGFNASTGTTEWSLAGGIEGTSSSFYRGHLKRRYPHRCYTGAPFVYNNTDEPVTPTAGSTIRIEITATASGKIAFTGKYDKTFRVNDDYDSVEEWFYAEVKNLGEFGKDYTWNGVTDIGSNINDNGENVPAENEWNKGSGWGFKDNRFYAVNHRKGTASRDVQMEVKFTIIHSKGTLIFETEPIDTDAEIYYETSQVFKIEDNQHQGNVQNQTAHQPAVCELDFFNCFTQGNGAESYRYKDAYYIATNKDGNKVEANWLNIDLRPTSTSVEEYKEVRRFADLTYSEPYVENTNLNGLNAFNLAKANYKEDIEKKYGFIQKLYSRDTDLLVFQEDKVSKVLYGKDLLMNADGTSNLSKIENVLGQQVAYAGEYGISRNPESFSYDGYNIYFTDAKRGAVLRLGTNGLTEISMHGMRRFFRNSFKTSIDNKKVGAIDPYFDQYVLHTSPNLISPTINMNCNDSITRDNLNGELNIEMDYGLFVGQAGFTYNTNGVPVKIDIEWNGNTYSTGYRGNSDYDEQLIQMGLTPVTGSGVGEFNFDKTLAYPSKAIIKISAPICGTKITFSGKCVEAPELTVVNVILNDEMDDNLTMRSRYKYFNNNYTSPYKSYSSTFNGDNTVDTFDTISGNQGSEGIPLNGSTVLMESYRGFNETGMFLEGNKLGYLVTDTYYTESQIEDLLDSATFLEVQNQTFESGDIINSTQFTFNDEGKQYLYLIWDYRDGKLTINPNTKIRIYFDSSGSMDSTLAPLVEMRDTLLKDMLLPMYNNDSDLYDESVKVLYNGSERTLQMLNMNNETPDGNVITLVFQDEASPYNAALINSNICPRTSGYDVDLQELRARLNVFPDNYYRAVVFQVDGFPKFKEWLQAVQNGTSCYAGANGLSDRNEFTYRYDVIDGGTPQYYLDLIVNALTELGYEL